MKNTYAYTLQVPAGCLLDGGMRYRDITFQKELLAGVLNKVFVAGIEYTMNFEKHKDGRYHVHGHCVMEDDMIVTITEAIKTMFNYGKNSRAKLILFRRIFNQEGWNTYCKKDVLLTCDLPDDSPMEP